MKYLYVSDHLKLIIEEDTAGFYLIVYSDPHSNKSTHDYLLDNLEDAFQEAKMKFNISSREWKAI